MTVADQLAAGAVLAVVPDTTGPRLVGAGSLATVGTIPVVPWGGGAASAMRMTSGHATITGAPSWSGGAFTVESWVMMPRAAASRTILHRQNGSTMVSVTVGADGVPVASLGSAAGSYSLTLRGSARVDDGTWHQIAVVSSGPDWYGTIEFTLIIDGQQVRTGQMRPGLFSTRPDLSMSTAVHVGGQSGAALLRGDMAATVVHTQARSVGSLAARWALRPQSRTAATGWGIILG